MGKLTDHKQKRLYFEPRCHAFTIFFHVKKKSAMKVAYKIRKEKKMVLKC